VLTRNTRSTALRTLRAAGLGDRFADADVLGRDEAPAKPAPGGVRALLAAWGLRPDQGVMVGDYLFDARAGRAAGAATVLVLRADDRGWEDEADLVLGDLRALLA
jgi:phosphoglycolate phosphatase-like HAD superfamily hydrolase